MKEVKKLIYYFNLGLKIILTNHIFQITILSISFILVSVVVYRAINLRKDVNKYENPTNQIKEKLETKVKIDYQETISIPRT